MIIRSLQLRNFGIYGGDYAFDLSPETGARFQRPIVLFRGQNGVGKTTLVEAIRLCLHGKLALGNRTTQRDYETYLERRLHRDGAGKTSVSAYIQLEFDHVFLGKQHRYRVMRSWSSRRKRLMIDINVWVDDEPSQETADEKEYLLRELVPAGVAELFFFDGEKITTLSEAGETSDTLLAETVKNLLGLHLVEQLDRDLDVYLMRHTGNQEMQRFHDELEALQTDDARYCKEYAKVQDMLRDCRRKLKETQESAALLKQRIIQEGGVYAEKRSAREAEREATIATIAQVEQEIYELSRGLLPFAAAPNLLQSLRRRLQREADFEGWQAAQPVLGEIEKRVVEQAAQASYWEGVANMPDEQGQQIHVAHFHRLIADLMEPPMAGTAVVHRISAATRGVLLNWIDEALQTAPRQLVDMFARRENLQTQLVAANEDLKRVPVEQLLQPLRDEFQQVERNVIRLEVEQERIKAEENRLAYLIERVAGSKRRVTEQITAMETNEERVKLAARTKLLLDTYQTRLIRRKLDELAIRLAKRFNQLSRKRNFIERVSIDPRDFSITLYRGGQPFPRRQLSAGEEQVFAVATLWALREVSKRPLPVIIDTPLSRLDDEHRRAMLVEFMPQVAQQVIVLATTSEMDDATSDFLRPVISRAYLLEAENTTAQVKEQSVVYRPIDIPLQEIRTHAA